MELAVTTKNTTTTKRFPMENLVDSSSLNSSPMTGVADGQRTAHSCYSLDDGQ